MRYNRPCSYGLMSHESSGVSGNSAMRVLCFDAKVIVHLENASPMTPEEVADQVFTELCVGADIPQAAYVVDYAIKDIMLTFAGEGTPIPDEDDDEDCEQLAPRK